MKRTPNKQNDNQFRAIATGILITLVSVFVLSGALSFMLLNGTLRENAAKYVVPIMQLLSAFIGCLVAAKLFSRKYMLIIAIVCAGCYLIQLAMTLLLFDCKFEGLGTSAFMYILGGSAAFFLCMLGKPKHAVKKRRL